ncbi:MAG: efflux RND transporter periplasmic adaptor subunit [Porticoccus sp.]|nr:efflux RND transporter periplasmic adaptor subunit [Porticoccus sp.]
MQNRIPQILPMGYRQLINTSLLMVLGLLISPAILAAEAPPAVPVTVVYPEQKEVTEWDEYTGRFVAFERVDIRARVAGYLQDIHFTDGEWVEKGALLFSLDPRPFVAAISAAKAEQARAATNLILAEQEFRRAKRLVAQKAMSQEELDVRSATMEARKADVEAARSALVIAELDLEYSRISAPIGGQISNKKVDIGNLIVAGGEQVLTSIVAQQPVYFVFDLSESNYLKYKRQRNSLGDDRLVDQASTVQVRLLDEQEYQHEGRVDFVDTHFDERTGTIRLRALFDSNAEGLLLPGSFGRVRLPARTPGLVLLIPDSAVMSDMAEKIVMAVDKENIVQPRKVELGALYQGLRIIRSGIDVEDRIITEGLLRIRPGVKVAPQVVEGTEVRL